MTVPTIGLAKTAHFSSVFTCPTVVHYICMQAIEKKTIDSKYA